MILNFAQTRLRPGALDTPSSAGLIDDAAYGIPEFFACIVLIVRQVGGQKRGGEKRGRLHLLTVWARMSWQFWMPSTARVAPGGMMFHVLNRGVAKNRLFCEDQDFLAFERIIADTLESRPMRILRCCLMPNPWHFVLGAENDNDFGRFMQRLTRTHVNRW